MEGDPPNSTDTTFFSARTTMRIWRAYKWLQPTEAMQGFSSSSSAHPRPAASHCPQARRLQVPAGPQGGSGSHPLWTPPLLFTIPKSSRNSRLGICAGFPFCNRRHWCPCAHRAACDYSKALQVITQLWRLQQLWKLLINSPQLLCPLHSD